MSDAELNGKPELSQKRKRRRLLVKIAAWALAAAVVLIVFAGIALTILLHSERFHNYLLRVAQSRASESLGAQVQLQNFALDFSRLNLDLYGITVHGAAPYTDPPLLQADHAEVSIRVVSILGRKWYLDSIRIDRPIVHIFVDDHGVSNLPVLKSNRETSGNTSPFDLAIRHAELNQGEAYYNNRQSVLDADLHDVEFQASFHVLEQKYSGRLAYADGHLIAGDFKPIPHNLDAEFDATSSEFHLTRAKLSTGQSQALLTATLQNYTNPIVDGRYDMTIDGGQTGEIFKISSIPIGQVHTAGSVHYQQTPNRSFLDSLVLSGDLSSRQLNVKAATVRTQITNLAAHYSLAYGDAALQDLKLSLLGGLLTGSGTMTSIWGNSHSKVNANLAGVSLAELRRFAGALQSARNVELSGALNARLTAAWGKNLDDLVAHADAAINGRVVNVERCSVSAYKNEAGMPVDSVIHGSYTASKKEIMLSDSYLRTPQTSLTLKGILSHRSNLDVHLQADDLREVEEVVDLFRASSNGQRVQPLGLAGTASFEGEVQGSTSEPHLTGRFLTSNLQVNGSTWKVLRTSIDASPSEVSLRNGDLEPATHGHVTFNASTGLTKWTFTDTSPIELQLAASQLNVADLTKLTGQQIPVSGILSANINVRGTELSPMGNGNVSLAGVVAYGEPVSSVKLIFSGTGEEAHANLDVQSPAGSVQSKVSIRPKEKTFAAQLMTAGIRLEKLHALQTRNIHATGEISLNASGQGSLNDPQLDATLKIPTLVIENENIREISLQTNVAHHVANANLVSSAINTNIRAKAQVNLTGDYFADATLDTQAIPLQPLLAVYAPEEAANVTGQTEIHATLHGPLKNANQLEAHVNVPTLKIAYGDSVQLAASQPIQVDYKNGVVQLQRSAIHGTDTDLEFQGSIPVAGSAAGNGLMSLLLQGKVNLKLAQLFDPDIRTSGELKFDIHSSGSVADSKTGGEIQIVDAAFSSGDLPIGLQHGNGVLTLTENRLNITNFQGTVGGGSLTAHGGATLQSGVQFDVGVVARGIRMLYPQGVRESVNANLRLAGSQNAAVLGGTVNVSDLSFTSAFDLNSFISQFTGGVATPPTPGFSQNLQLNLAVHSSNDISLVSRTVSVDGSANLQVRGTASNPVILGRVNLTNGDIILNGDRYLLSGGTIEFVNPYETQPVVNLSLKTTIQQYDVYLKFNGPVDQLRTNYSSDPALPSADIINLLAFGQTTEASANTTTTGSQAAQSLIASQVSSQITSRVSKIAGISQLSINPVLASGGSQSSTGANITIQQRVTSNLFVTFTSNLSSSQTETIQGQYQLTPKVAISLTRDQNGGFAVDTLIKKTW